MKSIQACAIPFFSLCMRLASRFCRSIASCGTLNDWKKKEREREEEKRPKNCAMRSDASIQYGESKERRTIFLLLDGRRRKKNRRARKKKREGVGDEKEKKKRRQDACTNHVLERLALCVLDATVGIQRFLLRIKNPQNATKR